MYQDMNSLYNREEQEYNEFMAKLLKKGKEVSDDYQKLSPENQQRIMNTIIECLGIEAFNMIFERR